MDKLRLIIVSVLLVGSGVALGSNVEWNRLHSNYMQGVVDGNAYLIIGNSAAKSFFDVVILVSCSPDGWHPSQGYGSLPTVSLRVMSPGETVSYETMLSDGLDYFYKSDWDEPIISDYSIALTSDDVYMGMAVESYDGNVVYGWLKFDPVWAGDIDCAWDIDGGAMYVGGGSAVPEPSSGMLVVVGLCLIGLRRPRCLSGLKSRTARMDVDLSGLKPRGARMK